MLVNFEIFLYVWQLFSDFVFMLFDTYSDLGLNTGFEKWDGYGEY